VFVLTAGILAHFFPDATWEAYLDPIASLLVVVLILWTTIPLVKQCSQILLQQVPAQVQVKSLTSKLNAIPNIVNVHDVHVWQLVDNMFIASLHVTIEEKNSGSYQLIIAKTKKVLHNHGIHSSTIQPEIVPNFFKGDLCQLNCIKNCPEDWCCKEDGQIIAAYDTFGTQL